MTLLQISHMTVCQCSVVTTPAVLHLVSAHRCNQNSQILHTLPPSQFPTIDDLL